MTDIESLLERLRAAAVAHAATQSPDRVPVRAWPPAVESGARRAVMDAWAADRSTAVARFLVPDPDEFVDLAFLALLGRPPDPVGRSHYLGRLQQGIPRLEVVAHLAASPEGVAFGGKPAWPLWLRPLLWGFAFPGATARRATRSAMRRIEGRLRRRSLGSANGLAWRLAVAIDERERFVNGELDAMAQDAGAIHGRLVAVEILGAAGQAASAELASRMDGLASRMDGLATNVEATVSDTSKALAAMRARMAASDYRADVPRVASATVSPAVPPAAPGAGAASASPSDADVGRYYLTLESVFRGDPARIRAQLESDYLDLMTSARAEVGDAPCIDVGCGRGEWLDVLRAHGFAARGVDLNAAMASVAREAGHEVIVGDALAYLSALADDSVLAVTAFHVAEHLDFPTLFRLVGECRRVLRPRGLLILETPNPENIWVATHTFHHDPTHGNPLTPASLEFLVNHHGLETVAVLRLHPYPPEARLPGNDPASERLNAMTCGGQDFAVVAKKTPPG